MNTKNTESISFSGGSIADDLHTSVIVPADHNGLALLSEIWDNLANWSIHVICWLGTCLTEQKPVSGMGFG